MYITTARRRLGEGMVDSTPLGENALIFTLLSATKGITIITRRSGRGEETTLLPNEENSESEVLWLCRPLRTDGRGRRWTAEDVA